MRTLPPAIRRELDACGVPWRTEHGGRHTKLYVAGRLAGVVPRGKPTFAFGARGEKNVISQVRRIAKEIGKGDA